MTRPSHPLSRRVRALSLLGAAGCAVAAVLSAAGPSAGAAKAHAVFDQTQTITRDHLIDGQDQVVDQRVVTVDVDQTADLRNHQEVNVSWSGAHPTGGAAPDPNSPSAEGSEYPVAIFECRGVDSPSAPADQRISPETCWTISTIERFASEYNTVDDHPTAFPPWRLDRYATPAERQAVVNAPDPYPSACPGPAPAERWVHFVGADGSDYPGGQSGCAGQPAEGGDFNDSIIPSNETYAATGVDGSGTAKVDVWTSEQNASLGCQQNVACALVVIPIMGISCDSAAAGVPAADRPAAGDEATQAAAACEAPGGLAPGSSGSAPGVKVTDTGTYWWSPSNWRNRFTVPLTFAPPGNLCDVVNSSDPVDIYGSELMTEAMAQWEPSFCLDPKLFRLKHIQTGEPQAVNLVRSGNAEAALAADPPPTGYPTPTVQAPAALTGFAVTYQIDDLNHKLYGNLRLTPRLIAKLLTESYPVSSYFRNNFYPPLKDNPLNIAEDPEFEALNPGLTTNEDLATAATMLFASNDTDVFTSLTSYINADPEARAWLDGTPDPWGMVVNPGYKGIALPVNSWPLLDPITPTAYYANNPCLKANPVPFLPLVAAPVLRFQQVSLNIQYARPNSQIVCQENQVDPSLSKLAAPPREAVGSRFIIGLTTLADATRFQLPIASLETQTASQAPAKFTDGTGRTFVGPTGAALIAAGQLLAPNATTRTWSLDYSALRSTPANAGAYPGTMLVSTSIPTTGLAATDAAHYAAFLRFTAGAGQVPGTKAGQLATGYVPLTTANGLGALPAYTLKAADAVAAQNGTVPALVAGAPVSTKPSPSATHTRAPSSSGRPTATAGAGASTSAAGPGTSEPVVPPASGVAQPTVAQPTPAVAPAPSASDPVTVTSLGKTADTKSSLAGAVFPLIALLAIGAGVGSAAMRVVTRRRG